jgi:hypothetical protein
MTARLTVITGNCCNLHKPPVWILPMMPGSAFSPEYTCATPVSRVMILKNCPQ